MRLNTDTALTPPVIRGVILEGFARTPLKYQFTARVKVSDYQYLATTGAKDHEPEDVIAFLKDAATKAKRMRLRSQWKEMDDIWVIVSPPAIYPKFSTAITSDRGDEVEFVMREA